MGHEQRQRPVGCDDDALRVHGAVAGRHGEAAVAGGVERLRTGLRSKMRTPRASIARENARTQRAGCIVASGGENTPTRPGRAHDRRQVGLVDPLGGQIVGAHRLVLDARVLDLVRDPGDAQAAHVRAKCSDAPISSAIS